MVALKQIGSWRMEWDPRKWRGFPDGVGLITEGRVDLWGVEGGFQRAEGPIQKAERGPERDEEGPRRLEPCKEEEFGGQKIT